MNNIYTITKHTEFEGGDCRIDTFVTKSYEDAKNMALKIRQKFKEDYFVNVEDGDYEEDEDEDCVSAWSNNDICELQVYIKEHCLI